MLGELDQEERRTSVETLSQPLHRLVNLFALISAVDQRPKSSFEG